MNIFYPNPKERLVILRNMLSESQEESNLNVLMNEYFANQSLGENVVMLVPSILGSSEDSLMSRIIDLLSSQCSDLLDKAFAGEFDSSALEKSSLVELREFVARVNVCFMKFWCEGSSHEKFLVKHFVSLFDTCSKLTNKALSLQQNVGVNKSSKQIESIAFMSSVSDILESEVSSLLLPLVSSLSNVQPSHKAAAILLPSLKRLLSACDELATRMPDVMAKHNTMLHGQAKRTLISRTSVAESMHPVSTGTHERTVSISGVQELMLEFDPKTFQSMGNGSSVALYRKPGMNDAIEGGVFQSMPKRPIKVMGDTVSVVYTAGFQSEWGFKVTAKAFVEEESMDLPWMLDLTQTVALLAGQCAGVLLSGGPLNKAERVVDEWVNSDLMSEGFEYDAKIDEEEADEFKWLPQTCNNHLLIPFNVFISLTLFLHTHTY